MKTSGGLIPSEQAPQEECQKQHGVGGVKAGLNWKRHLSVWAGPCTTPRLIRGIAAMKSAQPDSLPSVLNATERKRHEPADSIKNVVDRRRRTGICPRDFGARRGPCRHAAT